MNTQKEYGNDMDIDQVKDNNKTKPGETYEYKKGKKIPEESETQYYYQGKSAILQHWVDIEPDWI